MNPNFATRTVYYCGTTLFTAIVAIVCLFNSMAERSHMAALAYLAIMLVSAMLAVGSVMYMCRSQDGADDDVDLTVAGLPFGKRYYYIGMISIASWRVLEGFVSFGGHMGSSFWGIIWIISGIAVVGYTYVNFQSYKATHPAT